MVNAALKEAPASHRDEWFNFDHPCLGVNRVVDAQAGDIELLAPDGVAPRKKFALIGFSTATRGLAPLNDPAWTVVGMNQLQRHLIHAKVDENGDPIKNPDGTAIPVLRHGDLWFEIHKEWNTAVVPGTDHAGWLAECNIPVFMTDVVDSIPTSVRFPIERYIQKFEIDYFTSTVAYMFAWAIDHIDRLVEARLRGMEGGSVIDSIKLAQSIYAEYTIGVFGIDLIVGEEYTHQRPCAEYWLGQAMARGIELMIPEKSALLKQHYRYGYQIETEGLLRASDFGTRRHFLSLEHQKAHNRAVEMFGRLEELRNPSEDIEARERELSAAHQQASEQAVTLAGQLRECDYTAELRNLRERGGSV